MRVFVGISIGLGVIWLVGELIGVGFGTLWARHRARIVFARRLRRNGFPEDAIDEMVERYHATGLLRGLIRSKRVRHSDGHVMRSFV